MMGYTTLLWYSCTMSEKMLREELLLMYEVKLSVNFQYGVATSDWDKFLEQMRKVMIRILTYTEEDANTDEVQTVIQN